MLVECDYMSKEISDIRQDMMTIFEASNESFLVAETKSILNGLSERNLCGSLKDHLTQFINGTAYNKYHVDVEYNRNAGNLKTIVNGNLAPITITCDLIVHSRGEIVSQDNLIAIEMKRNTHSKKEKDKDKMRLKCLTKDRFDDVWSFDGTALPEHVCRYVLGVFYELNVADRSVLIKYYVKGHLFKEYNLKF